MGIDINKAKDKIFGATQQTEVSDIQMPVSQSTPNPIDIDKASQKVTFGGQWQEEQKKLEQNMKPILDGLPDKGRILQDRSTGKLHFVSDSYSTSLMKV
jgi:queuine/archaeosine tRNA-ribosyltransferase